MIYMIRHHAGTMIFILPGYGKMSKKKQVIGKRYYLFLHIY